MASFDRNGWHGLTEIANTLISLLDRTKLAKKLEADVFISLHCNHSDNPKARGVEVYVAKTKTEYSDESIYLSYLLQKGFRDKIGFESRGVKFANFQVLKREIYNCPSVLIEFGFLSNWEEEQYIEKSNSHNVLSLLVLSIAKQIIL